ncbi:c2H2-type domain-containing protein [Trichonephila clavipes]|uniref:C2H2-type domain-containing protein n=1 Tax=Trichonephila clavipes TaxID=2585209 RepID=A0A8X6SKG0_TRICX|nr:c2H2-type domain-containing protein [Trichonephila clavipes]
MVDNHCLEQQPFSGLSEKEIVVNAGKHVCAFCDEMFRTLKELKKHYEVSHDEIELKQEEHVFNTYESFQKWKKEELRMKSLFVKNGGVRKSAKNKQFSYYICNRSGIAKLKSERKRLEKIGGSVKCGKTCPAFMTAIREQKEEAIKITVQYQTVHACHEMQVVCGKLRLYEEDRRNLAALLKVGMPYTKIIENIEKKCPPTERLGLLTKKDLHNVSRDFEVDESILHAEDAVSVDLQVKKMQRDSYNPVLIYKPLGSSLANNPLIKEQDFILGIMTEAQLEFLELYGKKYNNDGFYPWHDSVWLLVDNNYDEDSNRLRREKEKEAILKEKSVLHEEPTELVYEQFMGVSPFCSSLLSIQHFPANKNIVQQRVQQKSRYFKKQKLANDTCIVQPDIFCNYTFIMLFTVGEAITGINYLIASVFYQLYPPPASYFRNLKF